jgi:hypothetical protein
MKPVLHGVAVHPSLLFVKYGPFFHGGGHGADRDSAACINSCGHLDRPHYAFGLCVVCYRISPEGRAVRRRYETSLKERKNRVRYAATPASREHQAAYAAARYVPRPPRPRAVNTCGHLDRPHKAKGRCQSCYDAMRFALPPHAKETPGRSRPHQVEHEVSNSHRSGTYDGVLTEEIGDGQIRLSDWPSESCSLNC